MKILLSPAKSLDYSSILPTSNFSHPIFNNQAVKLSTILKKKSVKQLKEMMSLSTSLAELNAQRYNNFQQEATPQNARPALFAFSGDVYVGLDSFSLSEDKIEKAQQTIRILSGMYGLLKPLDLIQPYRLEMGTEIKINRHKNLYQFWGDTITNALNAELIHEELIVNLASQEYFKSINSKKLKGKVVSPVFKDFKNGKLMIISFFAKKARGLMTRFILENEINTPKEIIQFNIDGYQYSPKETKDEYHPVFIR